MADVSLVPAHVQLPGAADPARGGPLTLQMSTCCCCGRLRRAPRNC